MNSPTPTLALLKKEHSEVVTVAVLVKLLESLIKFFNVGKSMSDTQVLETCKLILQEYYFLKIEDLKLCFDGMKTGKYLPKKEGQLTGQLFDRLDGNIILLSLNTYTEERIQQAEIISNEKHKDLTDKCDEEKYFVKIGNNYIRESLYRESDKNPLFSEVIEKEIATLFDFAMAIRVKRIIQAECEKDEVDTVKIVYSNKSEIGFIDYLKANRPDLVPVEKKPEPKKSYSALVYSIQMDNSLSDLQKENKIRSLSGLAAISEEEFKQRTQLLTKTKT